MERIKIAPRPDWVAKVEALGFDWHSAPSPENPSGTYWDESAYWRLTSAEVDLLESATEELHKMCVAATDNAIQRKLLPHFGFSPAAVAVIEASWRRRANEPSIYGRFDLAFTGGDSPPKLLEYNADTPTSLFEASVVQWAWLEERFPESDQFNSLHEGLVAAWAKVGAHLPGNRLAHFTSLMPHAEDEGTLRYMLDTALEAGLAGKPVATANIGWAVPEGADESSLVGQFVDLEDTPIATLFKIVPWDWLLADRYGPQLARTVIENRLTVIEPAWKMVMSNKAILAVLWELYPDHPYLLPAFLQRKAFSEGARVVAKPLLGREGANVSIADIGSGGAPTVLTSTEGAYGEEGYVYQALAPLASADGSNAVIGSWMIDGVSRGIGIREDQALITHNRSRFVPHLFE